MYALCSAWNREPEETIRRFKKGNENEWLVSVIPGKGRIYFSHVCEYMQETELYQTYQWACAFVHGQDIRSKMHPFTFYDSTYHLLTVMMSYIFEYSARDCAPQPLKLSIHSGGIEHPCRCR